MHTPNQIQMRTNNINKQFNIDWRLESFDLSFCSVDFGFWDFCIDFGYEFRE